MPAITGAHAIIYSKDAEADRAFLRHVLRLPSVDVGDGWLVFALPPCEVAVHPADENDVHELYLMVRHLDAFIAALARRGVACTAPRDLGWGVLTQVKLPGGGRLGAYEPRHARPSWSKRRTPSGARRSPAGARTTGRARGRRRTMRRG